MRFTPVILSSLLLALGVAQAQPKEQPLSPPVEHGSTVQLEYTLKDDAGAVLDSNKGREPLSYIQGRQQIVPGLEKALTGMRAGQEKQIVVKTLHFDIKVLGVEPPKK